MNTTRRYPRTLVEAFGPYATGPVLDAPRPTPIWRKAMSLSILIAIVIWIALVLFVARCMGINELEQDDA